jgi:hypothetical protein
MSLQVVHELRKRRQLLSQEEKVEGAPETSSQPLAKKPKTENVEGDGIDDDDDDNDDDGDDDDTEQFVLDWRKKAV